MSGGTGHQGSAVRGTVESGGHARGPGPPDGRGGCRRVSRWPCRRGWSERSRGQLSGSHAVTRKLPRSKLRGCRSLGSGQPTAAGEGTDISGDVS